MISIIICSKKDKINEILSKNIADTINVPYEIVLIDNSDNKYSIFSAYNEGIKRAKYPYLCFIHEDILFRTSNWGKLLINAFETDNKIGMVGVIGSSILFDIVYGWWDTYAHVGSIIQSQKGDKKTAEIKTTNNNNTQLKLLDAVVCDGLFLAFPKSIFNKIHFDSKTYKGFHCYDLDISMQVINIGYKIKVIDNILIEHFSSGNLDNEFINTCLLFSNKWHKLLPISIDSMPPYKIIELRNKYLLDILSYKLRYNHCIDLSTSKGWSFIYHYISPIIKIKNFLKSKLKNKTLNKLGNKTK